MSKNQRLFNLVALSLVALWVIDVYTYLEIKKRDTAAAEEFAAQNAILQAEIDEVRQDNSEHEKQIRDLADRVRELTDRADRGGDADRPPPLTSLGTYTVTAYCSCDKCCGHYARDRHGGKVFGAAGVELTAGVSVAGWLPFGSQIVIDGHEYIVQDRTAAWIREKYDGRIIDIYFDDHEAALDWGKQQLEVWQVR